MATFDRGGLENPRGPVWGAEARRSEVALGDEARGSKHQLAGGL